MTTRRALSILTLFSALSALSCAGTQHLELGQRACQQAERALKQRVGPELGRVITGLPLPLSELSYGCALSFTRIEEELPGEVSGVYGQASSHELAVYLLDSRGGGTITILPPPRYRGEGVRLELKLMELHGAAPSELVVTEVAARSISQYRALQVYVFAEGVPSPREIFSEPLRFKTKDGITVTGTWSVGTFEGDSSLVVTGGGDHRVFKWHEGLQSFKLDLAASARYKQGALKP